MLARSAIVSPGSYAQELIALAKAQPGKLSYGSSGIGNLQHLNGELFNKLAGTQIVHVPSKGASPRRSALSRPESFARSA